MTKDTGWKNLLKARHVWRWSIVNTTRRQNVAEHSYNVWVIGMELFRRFYTRHNTPEERAFSDYLLTHDSEEAVVGDIPSTTKAALERLKPGITTALVAELTGAHKSHGFENTPLELLAKAADIIEAKLFLIENTNGNPLKDVVNYQNVKLAGLLKRAEDKFPREQWSVVRELADELAGDYEP